MDSLLCGSDANEAVVEMLESAYKVLKPGGVVVIVSYGDPDARVPHFQKHLWDVTFYILETLDVGADVAEGAVQTGPILPQDFDRQREVPDIGNQHFVYILKTKKT